MVTTETAINCMVTKELITQEQADEMLEIVSSLPSDQVSLLQILIALTLTQEDA